MRNVHGYIKQPKDRKVDRHRMGWCEVCKHVIPRKFADHMSNWHARKGKKVFATDEQIKAWKDKVEANDSPTFGRLPICESDDDESDAEAPNHS